MENIVMREPKSTLIVGIICTLLFTLSGLFFALVETGVIVLFFLPFILLGVFVILLYYLHYIVLETNRMIVSEPFKPKKCIYYSEINTVLLHTTNTETELILINCKKERLLKFSVGMAGADKAVDILEDREIPCVDLSGMAEGGLGIEEYLPALTKWEQSFYRPQIRIMENARTITASQKAGKFEKKKRFVKIMGRVMIGIDLFAIIVLKGKSSYGCFVFVLLLAWGMYIWLYPHLFFEVSKKIKAREYTIEMPFLGIAAAALLCLMTLKIFEFDIAGFFIFIGVYTIILLLPFAFKLYLARLKPDKPRLVLTALAGLMLAFITAMPVNYLATFHVDRHEPITVKEKEIYSGSKTTNYYIYADWREDNEKFSVSKSEYKEIQKGDQLRICLRHSIFGFHYWTIHK